MITIKPIRTEADYDEAVELLEQLIDVPDNTPEADQLEILSVLIHDYEQVHYPVPLPTPIGAIKFRMEQSELKQQDLVPYIGSRAKVSEVLSGKRQLTLKMIRALHTALGIPVEALVQELEPQKLEELEGMVFEKFPLKEMINSGFWSDINISIDHYKDRAEELIRALVTHIGGKSILPQVAFRKNDSMRVNATLNSYSLMAWCMRIIDKVNQEPLTTKYDKTIFEDPRFISQLVSLSAYDKGVLLAKEHLEKQGIHLVYVPHLKNTHLDGASFMLNGKIPVVAITGRYDRLDNFWFVLLHELGHIKNHFNDGDKTYYVDDISLRDGQDYADYEQEADEFALESLVNDSTFCLDQNRLATKSDIVKYAQEMNITPAIIAGRWQHTQKNYKKFSNLIGRGEVREQLKTM